MKKLVAVTMFVALAASAYAFQLDDVESRGEILEVSIEDSTVTLEEAPEPILNPQPPGAMQSGVVREFVVNETTKLTLDGETVVLADVPVGSQATIVYQLDNGQNIAKSIELRTPTT